jgi:prepilin-type N-terminal cleavage/methylation domain-containing protein/prepilin-type processing-associated H-X9-DG protein
MSVICLPTLSEVCTMRRRVGFTLIELLVVIAIIAILIGLLVPAVQQVRAAAARSQCQNNMHQLGVALYNYESMFGKYPAGYLGNPNNNPAYAGFPDYFFSWSVLAQLNPFLEQTTVYNKMDLTQPIYDPNNNFNITVANQFAIEQLIPIFLCPSDQQAPVATNAATDYGVPTMGPTNYAFCVGTGTTNGGAPYGVPTTTDGMFQGVQPLRVRDLIDGTSNTACAAECLLGQGPENSGPSAVPPAPANPQYVYGYVGFGTPVTPGNCPTGANAWPASTYWNGSQLHGFTWASGEMRCAIYNHYYLPNSNSYDCVNNDLNTITAFGFHTARSNHNGGVNVLLADGSVHFVSNSVSQQTWTALATRGGQDLVGADLED